ncbi:MAG: polysaccharide deacetylase family protein [bacterium]
MTAIMHSIASPMVIGLAYHGTTPDKKRGLENIYGKHINAKYFEEQLRFIVRNYRIIKQSDLVDCLVNRKPLPRKAVFITFDDGYVGNYQVAFPLLKKYGLSATFFVPTAYVENGWLE